MHSGVRTGRVCAGLVIAGFLLRLLFLRFHPNFAGDSLVYADLATNMLRHHVYGLTDNGTITPTLIRLPGYPLFLAACFSLFGNGSFLAAVWIQIVLDLVDCCLLASLACRLWDRRAGLMVLGLSALCPFTANYCVTPLTETLSLLCVTAAFVGVERWAAALRHGRRWNAWLLVVGWALSFAVLLRPDRALLAAVIVPAMLWMGYRENKAPAALQLAPALAVAAAVLLPLMLWGARNWRVFHIVQPLAPKYANDPDEEVAYGFQRWYKTWAIEFKSTVEVYWPYDGSVIAVQNLPSRAFDDTTQRITTERLFRDYNEVTSSTPEIDAGFAALAQERIAAHPLRYYVLLPLARLADMWLRPRTELLRVPLGWWNWRAHPGASLFCAAYVLLNVGYLLLALVGLRRCKRNGWGNVLPLAFAMVGFVLLRCLLLATLDNSEQRYTLDCYPVVLLLAGYALAGKARDGAHFVQENSARRDHREQ